MQTNSEIEALLKVFDEPLRGHTRPAMPAASRPVPGSCNRISQDEATRPTRSQTAAAAPNGTPPSARGLIGSLVGISLIPTAILFVLLWQDLMRPGIAPTAGPAEPTSAASIDRGGSTQRKHSARLPEIVLSSPDRIQAAAGAWTEFPIEIDAAEVLPARSIVAVTALPEGASFSAGRPYGVTGWSLRPDEIGSLQLRLPERSGASDIQLALVAGDGSALAQSETRLSVIAASPEIEMTGAIAAAAPDQTASVQAVAAVAEIVPPPQRKPLPPTGNGKGLKVNTVKVVAIEPPQAKPTRPHDGAYALGSPADEPEGEWMVTKTAVDMHAKALQSSETVKVADKGLKLRVTARDKRWIQVTDPATSTTGWIYDRFLEPTDAPAQ